MKDILNFKECVIPDGVEVEINSRNVRVKGPRGELKRSFRFFKVDLKVIGKTKKRVRAELWMGSKIQNACIRSVISAIKNMMIGVTKGFEWKMRMVYAHFPINVSIENKAGTKEVAVRNFLGEKVPRVVQLVPGVAITRSTDVKDELVLSGIDVNAVSQSAASIQQVARVRGKDIRKFLDGIYVSERGNIQK